MQSNNEVHKILSASGICVNELSKQEEDINDFVKCEKRFI